MGCTSVPNFTDLNVINGTDYDYVVTATYAGGPAAGGASAPSAVASANPPCPTPAYAGSLTASKSGGSAALWGWTDGGATAYDLIRGDLSTLRSSGGDFQAAVDAVPAAEGGCLVNNTTSLSLDDPYPDPAVGEGFFTLIRPATLQCPAQHGTVDDGSQVQDRDPGIESASLSCP
jgi:hypothetical protein